MYLRWYRSRFKSPSCLGIGGVWRCTRSFSTYPSGNTVDAFIPPGFWKQYNYDYWFLIFESAILRRPRNYCLRVIRRSSILKDKNFFYFYKHFFVMQNNRKRNYKCVMYYICYYAFPTPVSCKNFTCFHIAMHSVVQIEIMR